MTPTRTPGNEPDPGDMSAEPSFETPNDSPPEQDLPEEDAGALGDFA